MTVERVRNLASLWEVEGTSWEDEGGGLAFGYEEAEHHGYTSDHVSHYCQTPYPC